MERRYEAYMARQEDEYHFNGAVEEIRRFAREEVLAEVGKDASERLLRIVEGLVDLSGAKTTFEDIYSDVDE